MAEFINVQGGGGVSSEVKITDGTNTVEVDDNGNLQVTGRIQVTNAQNFLGNNVALQIANEKIAGTNEKISLDVDVKNSPIVKIDSTNNNVKVVNDVSNAVYIQPVNSTFGLPVEIKNDFLNRVPVQISNPNPVTIAIDINNNTVKIAEDQTVSIAGTPSVNATVTGTPTVKIDGTDNTVKLDSTNNAVKIEAGQTVGISGTPSVNATITGTPTVKLDAADNTVKLDSTNNTVKIASGQSVGITGTPTVQISGTPAVSATVSGTVTVANPTTSVSITGTPSVNATITGTPSVNATITGTPTVNATITGTPSVNETITGTPSVNATVTGTPTVKIDQTQNGVSTSKSNNVKVAVVQLQPVGSNVSTIIAGVVGKKFRILSLAIAGLPGAFSAVISLQSNGASSQTFYRYRHAATAIYDRYINYGIDGIVLDEANAAIQLLSNQTYSGTQYIDVVVVYEEV